MGSMHRKQDLLRPYAAQTGLESAIPRLVETLVTYNTNLIYLQLTSDWTFELLAMACNKTFYMLNILLAIL